MRQLPVSVVIVSYNTVNELRYCLNLLEADQWANEVGYEVIVVDNASIDGSREMVRKEYPGVKLILSPSNVGFGSANNLGIKAAMRNLVLLLNSDAYVHPGAIQTLVKVFDDPTVVAAGPKLLNTDGSLQESSCNGLTLWAVFCEQLYLEKLFPHSPFFSPYWNSRKHHETAEVEQVMGACLMMRKGLALFDERFFLYCEDTELCKRLRNEGRILYVPEAEVTHALGSSSDASRWKAVAFYNRGKELYFKIHHGPVASFVCWWLNRTGALIRLIVWLLASVATFGRRDAFKQRTLLFLAVLLAPINGPRDPRLDQTPLHIEE